MKMCPLLTLAAHLDRETDDRARDCIQEQCQWWIKDEEESNCAIAAQPNIVARSRQQRALRKAQGREWNPLQN